MERRLSARAALWPASFTFVACGAATLLIAWDEVRQTVVLAVTLLLWGVVGLLLIALAVLVFSWTGWRLSAARADQTLNERAVQLAAELASPIRPATDAERNLWLWAYLSLGQLGWLAGSLSLSRMRPYFTSGNAERYWKHMVGEMKSAGYARVVTAFTAGGRPYKTTVFVGSYRKFFTTLMRGRLTLAPHPKLPAPVISARIRLAETMETTDRMEMTV